MSEKQLMNEVQLLFTDNNDRLFRQNTGKAWAGKVIRQDQGTITLLNPRPLIAGLCVGSSDLIGWRSREITIDMIGQRIAQFAAIEIKHGKTATTPDQQNFVNAVNAAGGYARIIRDLEGLK